MPWYAPASPKKASGSSRAANNQRVSSLRERHKDLASQRASEIYKQLDINAAIPFAAWPSLVERGRPWEEGEKQTANRRPKTAARPSCWRGSGA
jgi:hypothetical protein